ncbi:MAG: hypothetical protein AAB791_03190, partial [Patescibacteria group bacterium]
MALSAGDYNSQRNGQAMGETIFDSPKFVKIFATLTSKKEDFCRVFNDFTNPIVMEDASCLGGTTQSPTPWKDSQDACLNALVSARFNRPMADSTINKNNISVQRCTGSPDTGLSCGPDNLIIKNNQIKVFDYSHDIDYSAFGDRRALGNDLGALPQGFVVYGLGELQKDTWYRVIIRGGETGVRGSRLVEDSQGDFQEVEESQGILLTPSVGGGYEIGKNYSWNFKTASDICEIKTVNVSPSERNLEITQKQNYAAFPQAANCNILDSCNLNWEWGVKDKGEDEVCGSKTMADQESGIASITKNKTTPNVCQVGASYIGINEVDPLQELTAQNKGEACVLAEVDDKTGSGHLNVKATNPPEIEFNPCPNGIIRLTFDSTPNAFIVDLLKGNNIIFSHKIETLPAVKVYNGQLADNDFKFIGIWQGQDVLSRYVLNYLPKARFVSGSTYTVRVYSGGEISTEKSITIRQNDCDINEVVIQAWPLGEAKEEDAFFCDGDNCGADSDNPYLNDFDNKVSGNQHYYQAWAANTSTAPGKTYWLNADLTSSGIGWSFEKKAANNADTARFHISNVGFGTAYSGDQFVSLKTLDKDIAGLAGEAWLTVSATKSLAEQTVIEDVMPITVFLCDNPWPSPSAFPFLDSKTNCSLGTGNCINTNFKLFYCRDKGEKGTGDDLPALNESAVVKGVSSSQAGLIKEFLFTHSGSADALGLRVLTNNTHYSPLLWYRTYFDPNRQG